MFCIKIVKWNLKLPDYFSFNGNSSTYYKIYFCLWKCTIYFRKSRQHPRKHWLASQNFHPFTMEFSRSLKHYLNKICKSWNFSTCGLKLFTSNTRLNEQYLNLLNYLNEFTAKMFIGSFIVRNRLIKFTKEIILSSVPQK